MAAKTDKYYITTPIYYVNDVPHIGHAYTTVATDCIARFMRLSGKDVLFLTGTDEHGQKVEKSAIGKGIDPQSFTDQTSKVFQDLMGLLDISNDDFIRTTQDRHKKAVEHFWRQLESKGDIYLGKYCGWYSVRDEAFYNESELTENGLAPTGAPVEWLEEPSYFFALSKWQDKLLEFYEDNPNFIKPASRRNEVISFVKAGLTDLSVSRTGFKWGIKVPGDENHVIYVWLDALTNYLSALGYPDENPKMQYWPADAHIIGKDILRFHAVYWPAFLMAAGLLLPKCVMAHGWWTNEGQKISKSLGNVIDPIKLVEEFGLDRVRYFLMREVIFGNDGNYSRDSLISRINSELANKIGNLVQRTAAFVYKNNDKRIPVVDKDLIYKQPIFALIDKAIAENTKLIEDFELSNILNNIIHITEEANIYIDREAPWQLKKTDPQRMLEVLYTLLEVIRYIAVMLQPFIPQSANKILNQLAVDEGHRGFKHLHKDYAVTGGAEIPEPVAVFLRV